MFFCFLVLGGFPNTGNLLFNCFLKPMNPPLTLKNIPLSHVDFDDFTYSISPVHDYIPDETLTKSIASFGILHPPLVRKNNSGIYTIITGRKRLLALRALHAGSICSCLVISHNIPEIDAFHVLLEDIQLTRQLTIIEKAIFLQKTTALADERYIIREFLPPLGLAPKLFSIQRTLKLLDLEAPILRGIHHGKINEKLAHDLLELSIKDRMVLFEIITTLRLSGSYQKKMLNICKDLASRSTTSIAVLLNNDEVHDILHHQEANPPQKTKNLMSWLSRKHKPRYGQASDEFRRFITGMQLPQNVTVEHTPFFEDESMTLTITFPNRKSLQHAWEKIRITTQNSNN